MVNELPSGTVTFLFTDIESSASLWQDHPEAMKAALARHDAIVREAIAAYDGHVVKTTGDGFHAAFADPSDAVDAAIGAQLALAGEAWGDTGALPVRMGIHSGQAELRDGDYYGSAVNRAARLMSVAHGGQVVVSLATSELVREALAAVAMLVDLGEHRLRDLSRAERVFQVSVAGMRSEFPPLTSADAFPGNLPLQLTSFIGRNRELVRLASALREARVVTLTGVGGVGKTRLALQAASDLLPRYDDGVWFCELDTVLVADDLCDAVASALRYVAPLGVTVRVGLQEFLVQKRLLLILDNCEHLVGAVASFVNETTTHAPAVSVLATSREALGVAGEHISPLGSLTVPLSSEPGDVLASEAGALFIARGREANGDMIVDSRNASAICALCSRLDGIPLAIELAAAQTAMMTPLEIEQRLDRQFRLVAGGRRTALERHQTLRGAIDWSYDLLSCGARSLLARLSVCVGGFNLDAAEAIASGIDPGDGDAFELLRELVSKSLVERYELDGATRFRLLEMIRQYAAEKLRESGEDAPTRELHATYYLARTVELLESSRGDSAYEALDALGTETPNVAAAAHWLLGEGRVGDVLAFFGKLPFIDYFTLPPTTLNELGTIGEESVLHASASGSTGFGAACLLVSFHLFVVADWERYRRFTEAVHSGKSPASVMSAVICDSTIAMLAGDLDAAAADAKRAVDLARARTDPALLAWLLSHYAVMTNARARAAGNPDASAAIALADEAMAIAHSEHGSTIRFYPLMAVVAANQTGDPVRARAAVEEIERLDHTQRRWWASLAASIINSAPAPNQDVREKLIDLRRVLAEHHEHGERFLFATFLASMAQSLAASNPALAADIAAVAESDAIAPEPAFSIHRELSRLAFDQPELVREARAAVAGMTYDDAIQHIFAVIDEAVADLDPSGMTGS